MPRAQSTPTKSSCSRGRSYFSRYIGDHDAADTVVCYRCGARMGCKLCCERDEELICLDCHNWAARAGVERHGDVTPSDKVKSVRTDGGWRYFNNTAHE